MKGGGVTEPPPGVGQQAVGTHPIGMHSCLNDPISQTR